MIASYLYFDVTKDGGMVMWTGGPRPSNCTLADWEALKTYWVKLEFTTKWNHLMEA
jgi:hypothetical protein